MIFHKLKSQINWKLDEVIERIVLILLVLIGLVFNFDTVKKILVEQFFPESTGSDLLILYTSVIAAAIVTIVFRLGSKLSNLKASIENSKLGIDEKLFAKGTTAIFGDVKVKLAELLQAKKTVQMDVLGYMLFSIQSELVHWKRNPLLKNITLNLYYLDRDYILANKDIKDNWAQLLDVNLSEINKFREDEKVFLKKNRIKINLIPYAHLPAVHGFRLEGVCMYMSFASWDDGKLHHPADHSDYIKIDNGDSTLYAQYLRKLFDNWVNKAKQ